MSNYATALVSPWAIAWLIQTDDWDHLERVIHHNCSILGGCHNVLIPVAEGQAIGPLYETFLDLFDPDYVVLGPGMPVPPPAKLAGSPLFAAS